MNTPTIRAVTISAIVLGFSAAAAFAGSSNSQFVREGTNSHMVRFPDLDLSKTDGVALLYRRLHQAAGIVCSPLQDQNLGMAVKYRACVDRAIAGAVASVKRPMLSQYFELQTKGGTASMTQLARAN